jgi:hypothetical protein
VKKNFTIKVPAVKLVATASTTDLVPHKSCSVISNSTVDEKQETKPRVSTIDPNRLRKEDCGPFSS